MKVIILCGGLGTRLGHLTKLTPKPMLEIEGKPFIAHLMNRLSKFKITGFILAVSYQWEKLRDYIGNEWNGLPVEYSIEEIALGTGGAIKKALDSLDEPGSLVVNGDTFFDINISEFIAFAKKSNCMACLALRKIEDCSRYGKVLINSDGKVISFGEKGEIGPGFINGGLYFLKKNILDNFVNDKFSFEKDYLDKDTSNKNIYGLHFDNYFIDIGIPKDFERARVEFRNVIEL